MTQTTRYHPLAECETCPLYEENTFVPSVGPEKARLVLVGEAPGAKEVRTGEPFTGPSGELLNILLKHAGVDRSEVMITNVCLCRPRNNANPPKAAIRSCSHRLRQEILAREPETIVALGNFASKAILGTSDGITKTRVGPPKYSERYPGVSIIPTFHPAASLYNADVFPDIVTDFGKIGVTNVGTTWSEPKFRVFDDPGQADRALSELLEERYREVALDIEVGIEKDVDFDHPDRYRLLCIGISYRRGAAIVLGERACESGRVRHKLQLLLENKQIIAQNGKFDLAGLRSIGKGKLSFDTMLAHYCLDERRGTHSLDQLAVEYLGAPNWKDEIKRYLPTSKNYADVPREVLYKYNAYDVANTLLLKEVFAEKLKQQGLWDLHDFLVECSGTLLEMELAGVAVDEEYLEQAEKQALEDLDRLETDLSYWVENPRSPKQVAQALKDLGARVASTDRETLEFLQEKAARKNDEDLLRFTTLMLEYRKEHKLYGTYIKGIRQRIYRGRVHPTFLLHGTVTGRLSSRNPNLQNIPRESQIRRLFVPSSPDHVLVQADYRQAELRVVCGLAQDPYLREVFSDDSRDIHGEVATRFYGPNWTKEQRVRAKAVVFGLTYGREAYSLAAEFGMTVAEAEHYIETFFEVIPHTVKWIEELEQRVLEGEDLVSPFGRHRRFWLISDANKKNILKEARAFLPQSTASDLTLKSANRLAALGLGDLLRIPVHDALVLEVPQEEAKEVTHLVKQVMEETGHELFDGYVPFPVDVKVGNNWGEL